MKRFEVVTKETVFTTWIVYAESADAIEQYENDWEKYGDDYTDDMEVLKVKEVTQ